MLCIVTELSWAPSDTVYASFGTKGLFFNVYFSRLISWLSNCLILFMDWRHYKVTWYQCWNMRSWFTTSGLVVLTTNVFAQHRKDRVEIWVGHMYTRMYCFGFVGKTEDHPLMVVNIDSFLCAWLHSLNCTVNIMITLLILLFKILVIQFRSHILNSHIIVGCTKI
jgi:hypothetical protein